MSISLPDYEHAVLYYPASPPAYQAGRRGGRGFIYTSEGLGQLDFAITGVVARTEHPTCTMPECLGILDEYAGIVKELQVEELATRYIRQGEEVTEELELIKGIDPLRTLFISDRFGDDVPGGLTIYGVDVLTDNKEAVYVGIASRLNIKEEFIFRKWVKIKYPGALARPIVSGREFKLLIYTKGAGAFTIRGVTVWAKLTDRRGFNTSPQGAAQAQGEQT